MAKRDNLHFAAMLFDEGHLDEASADR